MKNITTTEEFNSVIQSEQPVIVNLKLVGVLIVKQWICGLIQSLTSITTINGIL